MDVQITPEPTEEERAAILRALELEAPEEHVPPAWWHAGLEEPAEDDYAILVRPCDHGFMGALVDPDGVVLPVGVFAAADAAMRSALRARSRAAGLVRTIV